MSMLNIRVHPELKKHVLQWCITHHISASEFIRDLLVDSLSDSRLGSKYVNRGKEIKRRIMLTKARSNFTEEVGELYLIKNLYKRILDICFVDYLLHRKVNKKKLRHLKDKGKSIYHHCSANNKKLMKDDLNELMMLDEDKIIGIFQNRILQKRMKEVDKNSLSMIEYAEANTDAKEIKD